MSDYLGKIELVTRFALVLGDMPLATTVWGPNDRFALIVRVFYMDSDARIACVFESSSQLDFSNSIEEMGVNIEVAPVYVFDSARPGAEIRDSYLQLDLAPGDYLVRTKQFEPDDRTSVLIHRFEPA